MRQKRCHFQFSITAFFESCTKAVTKTSRLPRRRCLKLPKRDPKKKVYIFKYSLKRKQHFRYHDLFCLFLFLTDNVLKNNLSVVSLAPFLFFPRSVHPSFVYPHNRLKNPITSIFSFSFRFKVSFSLFCFLLLAKIKWK